MPPFVSVDARYSRKRVPGLRCFVCLLCFAFVVVDSCFVALSVVLLFLDMSYRAWSRWRRRRWRWWWYTLHQDVAKLADHVIGLVRRSARGTQSQATAGAGAGTGTGTAAGAAAVSSSSSEGEDEDEEQDAAPSASSSAQQARGAAQPRMSPSAAAAANASAAYARLVDEMRRDATITGAEATLLRRLFAANDAMCHAAWDVLRENGDVEECKDTLARIVAREKERSTQSRQRLISILQDLSNNGMLEPNQAEVLVDIVSNGHMVS